MLRTVVQQLAGKLPSGWRISRAKDDAHDAILKVRAPRGQTGLIAVEAKQSLEPRDVDLLESCSSSSAKRPAIIVAPFISPRVQQRLKARGLGYADVSGNIHLSLSQPGLLIETTGTARNPNPTSRERKSLKGPKAGRLIRALCDYRPPIGIRELAKRAGIDAGYASRLIDYLDREALVTRVGRGPVASTDWQALIRRWSEEYSPFSRVTWYLAPRGISNVPQQLKSLNARYTISGSWAAAQVAPVSPTRLLLCYIDDPSAVARTLDLRPAEAGANCALATPFDPVVYERTTRKDGITVASLSQVSADLLTSPGRGPSEAEALMQWMREHEDAWRH